MKDPARHREMVCLSRQVFLGVKNMITCFARLLAVCLVLSFATPLWAADAKTAPVPDKPAKVDVRVTAVNVQCDSNDSIGARLGTAMKEAFNSSNLFRLSNENEPKMTILISTAPEFPSRPSLSSVYSVTWTFSQANGYLYMLLDRQLGTVGADEVDGLVAKLVEKSDGLSVKYSNLWKK